MKFGKIFLSLVLAVGIAQANTGDKIVNFLKISIKQDIVVEHIKIKNKVDLSSKSKWHGYVVGLKFQGKKEIKDMFFSDGTYITQSLVRMQDGNNMRNVVMQKSIKDLPANMYSKEALIYGNGDSKNQMMIISDPLCPFCIPYINKVLKFVKNKDLKNVDIYYYSLPLKNLHPASEYLSTYLFGLKLNGVKNVYNKYYKYAFKNNLMRKQISNSDAKNILLKVFSQKQLDLIKYNFVNKLLNRYVFVITKDGINGTPFVFFNHKIDETRNKIFDLVFK